LYVVLLLVTELDHGVEDGHGAEADRTARETLLAVEALIEDLRLVL